MGIKLRDLFEGRDQLLPANGIVEFVQGSPKYDREAESNRDPGVLLLFQTSRQRTWLVTTSQRLYCVLDDKEKKQPELRWTLAKDQVISAGALKMNLGTRDVDENIGLVDIGHTHKDWYYSKHLFTDAPVQTKISDMVLSRMS